MRRASAPLQQAAADAWAEVESHLAAYRLAVVLAVVGPASWHAALDAAEVLARAYDRAQQAQRLADHHAGAYNAWDDGAAS